MQISKPSAFVGLVAAGAIGFVAATAMQSPSNSPAADASPLKHQTDNSVSQATQNRTQASTVGEPLNKTATIANSGSTNVVSSGNIDIDQLVTRKKYASGFSAQLTLMNQIGQADFDELQSLAISLLEESQQHLVSHSLQLIGLRMVELDRDETMQFLFNHFSSPSATRSIYEVHSIIDALAGTHYHELISWAENLPDKQSAYGIRSQVMAGLARVDPEEALALYSEYSTDQHGEVLYSLLQGWSENDPQSAMLWALNQSTDQPGPGHDMHATEIVFGQWLTSDYSSAKSFLHSVSDEKIKARLELTLINEMAYQDPQSAIDLALGMQDDYARSQAFETAFYGWSSTSLMDAIDYATYSLSGEDQERAYYIIGMSAGNSGPGQFGRSAYDTMVMTESMPEVLGEQIRMSTMYHFFQEDAQAAMQWIDGVADPVEREQLLSTVAYDLAQTDLALAQSMFDQSSESVQMMLGNSIAMELHNTSPESAWSWYDQLPVGEVKTSLLQSMIYSEAQTNPEKALQLVMDNRGEHGDDMLMSVFANAAGNNSQWARDWLDQADIAPDMAEQLRVMLEDFRMGGFDRYDRYEY